MDPLPRPPLSTYSDLAQRVDHWLLAPELTSAQVLEGLEIAKKLAVAAAVVRPCDIDLAVRALEGSPVRVASVAGFPHGSQNSAVKVFEARDLLRRGARQVDLVVATSKLLSREFQHVQTELNQIADACRQHDAILKIVLEMGYLTYDCKIIACRCVEHSEADAAVTSTGFAAAKPTVEDVALLRKYLPEEVGVELGGEILTADQALEWYQAGSTSFGAVDPAPLLDEWKARVAAAAPQTTAPISST